MARLVLVLVLLVLAGLTGCPVTSSCHEGTRFDEGTGTCIPTDAGVDDAGDAGVPPDGLVWTGDGSVPPDDAMLPDGSTPGPDAAVADACVLRTFYADSDGDGFGVASMTMTGCVAPMGFAVESGDCDDTRDDVSPMATEICDMAMVDEDCDATANEGCECWIGQTRTCPGESEVGECVAGTQRCGMDGRWLTTCEGTVRPMAERCDGLDNDCDMVVDGAVADGTCPTWPNGTPRCLVGGTCGGTCRSGYADCNGGAGCETMLGTTAACTACGDSCAWRCGSTSTGCDDPTGVAIGVSGPHTVCVSTELGSLYCWGDSGAGEVLGAAGTSISRPTRGTGLPAGRVIDTAVGANHACAIVASGTASEGTVYCWGDNSQGQLGNGTTTDSSIPVRVGITTAVEIAAGLYSTCARLASGNVQCWGYNVGGQLGDGTTTRSTTPVAVVGLGGTSRLDGALLRYCAIDGGGDVVCWGVGHTGRQVFDLGTGRRASALAVGGSHTCAVHAGTTFGSAAVSCWGEGSAGEIGDGSATDRAAPTVVSGAFPSGTSPVGIGAGSQHTCVVASDGSVRCWGANAAGQLGDGSTSNRTSPVLVSGVTGAAVVDGGHSATCVVLSSGQMRCWGSNASGELGNGTTTASTSPVLVSAP